MNFVFGFDIIVVVSLLDENNIIFVFEMRIIGNYDKYV